MALGPIGFGFADAVDEQSATQLNPIGALRYEGGIWYRYVQADDAITQYQACTYDHAAATDCSKVTPTGATTDHVAGVAQIDVTDEYYFWLAISGNFLCKIATGASAGDLLSASGTAGVLALGGATDGRVHVCGKAMQAGAATNAAKLVVLECPVF